MSEIDINNGICPAPKALVVITYHITSVHKYTGSFRSALPERTNSCPAFPLLYFSGLQPRTLEFLLCGLPDFSSLLSPEKKSR